MSDSANAPESLAARLAGLSSAKRALLELRLKENSAELESALGVIPSIGPRLRSGPAPLSFAQQRLWFLDQLDPHSAAYNVPCRARLSGVLDRAALQRALETVVQRHESLRTIFPAVDGEPSQVVRPAGPCDLPVFDLSILAPSQREAEIQSLAMGEARRPFDLAVGPLFRTRLLRLNEEEHLLLLTVHHIASDGWSVGLLFRELGTLYEAYSAGESPALPELPIQYADYAVWQRAWLQGPVLDRQLTYWKRHFRTLPAPLDLATDHPRPEVQTHRGARVRFALPRELVERLKALGLREGTTPFMTLLAAFQVLLARYTDRDDIVVGSPIAGRTRPETEGLIGFFINTLALRCDLSGDPVFPELLGRVREMALGAYANQDLPFEKLVEELQPERDLSHAPLFQVMFALQNAPRSERRLRGLTMEHMEIDKGTAKFDLGLRLAEEAEGLRGVLSYNTDLFDSSTIERMAGHYRVLLDGIAANPSRRISALPLLTEAERRHVLVTANATAQLYSSDRCIHELIEEQAARTPEAIAVRSPQGTLSYDELNQRGNRLAHSLRLLGVVPDMRVGLCGTRSTELLIGLLGILKAGGAYVPIDPDSPRERLVGLLEDARAELLVIQEELVGTGLADDLASTVRRVVPIGPPSPTDLLQRYENFRSGVTPDNLAYVMYTSGSTGVPKGVLVPHLAVVNLSSAAAVQYGLGPADRVLHLASLTSDFSVEELFPAWLSGAGVVVPPPGPLSGGTDFCDLLKHDRISILLLPTAFWHTWVEELHQSRQSVPATLRVVSIGGEQVRPETFDLWQTLRTGRVRWFNTYGPTETTVEATLYEPAASLRLGGSTLPIGRPIANTSVYVLDRRLQPVSVGVPGELCIGGDGLARGYLGRPALTAQRFVPDPFGPGPGARLYRTGDRVRRRIDGTLEFIGRVDQQVKIRGYRVELGEVEGLLGRYPSVREGVVVAREDSPGDRRLVAYVVPTTDPPPTGSELRRFLAERLPEYMLPASFVFLGSLPVTPTGKVNRSALPPPDQARPSLEQAFVGPRTPAEATIAEIWASVLRVERVGVDDNFFALGGHSLLATQVVSRMRAALGVDVPLRALFETPTISDLAQRVDLARQTVLPEASPLVRLPRESYRAGRNLSMPSGTRIRSMEDR